MGVFFDDVAKPYSSSCGCGSYCISDIVCVDARRTDPNPFHDATGVESSLNVSYQYEKTSLDLYRAIFFDNYPVDVSSYLKPDKELANAEEIALILHMTWNHNGRRPPDIVADKDGNYQPDTGGTTFDRPGALKLAQGDFFIPHGTPIPPDLKIRNDGWNKRLNATHYTIMPKKPMKKEYLKAMLDNFVRSAIAEQWEKARGL